MKFVAAKCPNCGNKIEFNKNEKVYRCEYCRHVILFDDGNPINNDIEDKIKDYKDNEIHTINMDNIIRSQQVFGKISLVFFVIVFVIILFGFFTVFDNIRQRNESYTYEEDTYNYDASTFNFTIDDIGVINNRGVASLLDKVINQTENYDRTITIVYNNTSIIDTKDIAKLVVDLRKEDKDYLVTNDKNEEGYIYKIVIENIE